MLIWMLPVKACAVSGRHSRQSSRRRIRRPRKSACAVSGQHSRLSSRRRIWRPRKSECAGSGQHGLWNNRKRIWMLYLNACAVYEQQRGRGSRHPAWLLPGKTCNVYCKYGEQPMQFAQQQQSHRMPAWTKAPSLAALGITRRPGILGPGPALHQRPC